LSESESIAERARLNREIVNELLEQARRLREKARKLAKETDVFAAKAAEDYADYLEEAADQWPRIQHKQKV